MIRQVVLALTAFSMNPSGKAVHYDKQICSTQRPCPSVGRLEQGSEMIYASLTHRPSGEI
jgi:hypothetical protein